MSKLLERWAQRAPAWSVRLASAAKAQGPRFGSWRRMRSVVGPILDSLDGHERGATQVTTVAARSEVSILRLDTQETATTSIVKVAWNDRASKQIKHEAAQLAALADDDRLAGWKPATPTVLAVGLSTGVRWVAQSFVEGTQTDLDASATLRIRSALAAIAPLHAATARPVDKASRHDLLSRIVDQPFATAIAAFPQLTGPLRSAAAHCRRKLETAPLVVGRIHGDLAPANLLWDESAGEVIGIVDWELAQPNMPAEIDTAHFVLSYSAESQRAEYGRLVAECLRERWERLPADAVHALHDTSNDWSADVAVLIGWVHHIAANLTKADRYRANTYWRDANVLPVTDAIAELSVAGVLEG